MSISTRFIDAPALPFPCDPFLPKNHPVTLLMACPTNRGSIVVGADTREVDFSPPLIYSHVAKLRHHPEASLMWGYVGHVGTGTEFVDAMTVNEPPPPTDWTPFINGAKAHLFAINEARYRRDRSGERIGALFAGFLGDKPGIVTIDFTGDTQGPEPLQMRAIGSVGTMAYGIWDQNATDTSAKGIKDRMINTFVEICNRRALSIGPPWDVFEIKPISPQRLTPEWE